MDLKSGGKEEFMKNVAKPFLVGIVTMITSPIWLPIAFILLTGFVIYLTGQMIRTGGLERF